MSAALHDTVPQFLEPPCLTCILQYWTLLHSITYQRLQVFRTNTLLTVSLRQLKADRRYETACAKRTTDTSMRTDPAREGWRDVGEVGDWFSGRSDARCVQPPARLSRFDHLTLSHSLSLVPFFSILQHTDAHWSSRTIISPHLLRLSLSYLTRFVHTYVLILCIHRVHTYFLSASYSLSHKRT